MSIILLTKPSEACRWKQFDVGVKVDQLIKMVRRRKFWYGCGNCHELYLNSQLGLFCSRKNNVHLISFLMQCIILYVTICFRQKNKISNGGKSGSCHEVFSMVPLSRAPSWCKHVNNFFPLKWFIHGNNFLLLKEHFVLFPWDVFMFSVGICSNADDQSINMNRGKRYHNLLFCILCTTYCNPYNMNKVSECHQKS